VATLLKSRWQFLLISEPSHECPPTWESVGQNRRPRNWKKIFDDFSKPWKRVTLRLYTLAYSTLPGLDVMFTIFSVSCQFSAKIFFLKNQCYDHIFAKTSCSLSKKRQFFREIFWRKYFKNHNIGPCSSSWMDCCLHRMVKVHLNIYSIWHVKYVHISKQLL
jgi:hypothetical protein